MIRTFFCFKQKTAYEMRISDWSSDVCSSDLLDREQERHFEDRAALAKVLADALLLGERIIRLVRGCRHGELHLWGHLWAARPRSRLNRQRRSGENRQWEVAGIAGTSTPSPATSDCRLVSVFRYCNKIGRAHV